MLTQSPLLVKRYVCTERIGILYIMCNQRVTDTQKRSNAQAAFQPVYLIQCEHTTVLE